MKNCAVILALEGKPQPMTELLFKPLIDWAMSAARESGAEEIFVVGSNVLEDHIKGRAVFISSEKKSPMASVANAVFGCGQEWDSVSVLFCGAVFVTGDMIRETAALIKGDIGVSALVNEKDSEPGAAFCFSGDSFKALFSHCSKNFEETVRGADRQCFFCRKSEIYMLPTGGDYRRVSEAVRLKILDKLGEKGVLIHLADGVIISPDSEIGEGTRILPGTIVCGSSKIGKGCIIGPSSYVCNSQIGDGTSFNSSQIRNAEIKDNADIGPFAQIRPDSVIGDEAHLGNFVEVKNSSIGRGTKVSHLTYVGDSDVGAGVNFGCGVVTVNYTGKSKHRTTIRDGAFIGCNTNLVAPVTVGENSYTAAGSTITEDVPDNSLGIARARQVNKLDWVKRKQPYKKKV